MLSTEFTPEKAQNVLLKILGHQISFVPLQLRNLLEIIARRGFLYAICALFLLMSHVLTVSNLSV